MIQLRCIWGITTEAYCDSCKVSDYRVLYFVYFCIWLVTCVSLILLGSHSFGI
jgi:hypothetical protein